MPTAPAQVNVHVLTSPDASGESEYKQYQARLSVLCAGYAPRTSPSPSLSNFSTRSIKRVRGYAYLSAFACVRACVRACGVRGVRACVRRLPTPTLPITTKAAKPEAYASNSDSSPRRQQSRIHARAGRAGRIRAAASRD